MEPAVAFVLAPGSRRCVGMAFLVKGRTLMTCAHVVNVAIGRGPRDLDKVPDGTQLQVWFPRLGSETDLVDRWAIVSGWRPQEGADFELADVALLYLQENLDAYQCTPLTLSTAPEPVAGTMVSMSGPNPSLQGGLEVVGEVMGMVAKNRLQIDEPAHKVAPGYSGGPVCDRHTGEVVAMVQAVPASREQADIYALAAPLLRDVLATADSGPPQLAPRPGEGHVSDHAELHFDGESYRLRQVRHLYNAGKTPIAGHEFKVAVEHDPHYDKKTIADYHRVHPLVPAEREDNPLAELEVEVWYTLVRPGADHEARADIGIRKGIPHDCITVVKSGPQLFEFRLEFPDGLLLMRGAEAVVEYSYRVGAHIWGQWFQRNIKPNTETLDVDVSLPARLHPEGWGMSLAPSDLVVTVLPGVTARRVGDDVVFSWKGNADDEDLSALRRIRLEWFFWSEVPDSADCADAAAVLGRFGIRQVREPRRGQPRYTYKHLPRAAGSLSDFGEDRRITRRTLAHLRKVAGWVGRFHQFDPAVSRGLAAPQLGMGFPIAIVSQPADGSTFDEDLFRDGWLELVNPKIVGFSVEETADYEGCLSFFDYRGRVTRPWAIRIEFDGSDGTQEFTGTLARSIHHEIDHLQGLLYTATNRMRELKNPLPVREYRQRREPPSAPPQGELTWRML